jgi:hypothetical protein
MAENKGNTAVPDHGDRDRVAMLSLRADGTPDQHNPEIIGEREFAEQATRRQFREQAVSAVDTEKRRELAGAGAEEDAPQDPAIQELQDAHESAAKAAESAADSTVGALFAEEEQASSAAPAGDSPAPKKVTRSASTK